MVYQLEILLLFIALIVVGPLVGRSRRPSQEAASALAGASEHARPLISIRNA
jgi:hypothetical protein